MNIGPADMEFTNANSFYQQGKNFVEETQDIDLGVLHPDPFLDTANRKKTDSPVGAITYLDYVELPEDEKGFKQMALQGYNRFFEVGTFNLEVPLKDEQMEDLKTIHSLDVDEMIKQALYEESSRIMKTHLYNKYKDLGEINRKESLNKYQSKLETKWNVPAEIVLKSGDFIGRRLGAKIIGAANSIAVSSRRGPGDFVVLNNILASIITDCPEFHLSEKGTMLNSGIHQIGVLSGHIRVFVNPFEKENVAVVGRTPHDNDPGVYVMEYTSVLKKVKYQVPFTLEIEQKTHVRNRTAFVGVGKKPESCYRLMRFVFEDTMPIWKKLLNKVVKPPIL